MNKIIMIILGVCLVGQTGCAKHPSLAELEVADYGTSPSDYETQLKSMFSRSLFDPYSAVFEFSGPYKGYAIGSPIQGGSVQGYGWFVNFNVNAKNRFGAYTGASGYKYFYSAGYWRGPCLQHLYGWSCPR